MRILQLHCDHIEYTPTKKEIASAEEITPETRRLEEVVVAFVAVEKGDGNGAAQRAVSEITQSMERIGCKKLLLYPYAHLSSSLAPPPVALQILREMESAFEGMDVERAPFGWTKSYKLAVKGHPMAESYKVISEGEHAEQTSDALKSESKIRSFWYVLTPEGTMEEASKFDYAKNKNLEVLARYETAKKRGGGEPPHVALMKKMAIADYEPASDSGNMRFYPNGRLIKSLIEQYVTQRIKQYGGYEVETPIMYDSHHPSMESYFNRFPARQYNIDSEGKRLFLRFAACFGQFLMANDFQMSYRNLPYRLYEMTRYSFRREQSGELVGLRRLRAFTMPDCHAFCKDMAQAVKELETRFDLSKDVIAKLGISDNDYEMAIRFTEEFYTQNKDMIHGLVKKHGKPVLVEMWKERFFYFVLKWEFNYIDNLGKASALSTDQIDVENGERYGIEFVDEANAKKNPIILHNSPSGAIERVMYALLEKAAADSARGKKPGLPLWLIPTQVRVIPIREEHLKFASDLADKIQKSGIRADVDDRNENLGRRIRDAEKEWIPYIIAVGEKEVESETLSVRRRDGGEGKPVMPDELVDEIKQGTAGKPFSGLNAPFYLSRRPQIMV